VVEVGIDVPNASFILIESADRFGLAQLHQFRGRVGRGEHRSYCILMAEDASETSMQRLAAMEATNDGFALAEKDLELRGPGDFLGVRQSGMPELRVAELGDAATLEKARTQAQRLFAQDPGLQQLEHTMLAEAVRRFWSSLDLT
jgi:ATP-dependent DNA helicase RecG